MRQFVANHAWKYPSTRPAGRLVIGHRQWGSQDWPPTELTARCLLVLDGLDETSPATRPLIRQALAGLQKFYGLKHIIVTCRIRSYVGEMRLPGFADYRLAPFDEKQIENFDQRQEHLKTITSLVDEAQAVLESDSSPLREIGKLLNQSWQLKRELADNVTTPEIDEIYGAALDAGAIGGKLLGAGGGGFMLLFVEPDKQAAVKEKLKDLVRVDFGIDDVGSKIVLYEPGGLENR